MKLKWCLLLHVIFKKLLWKPPHLDIQRDLNTQSGQVAASVGTQTHLLLQENCLASEAAEITLDHNLAQPDGAIK